MIYFYKNFCKNFYKKQKGFFIVEVLVSTAVTAAVVVFLLGLVQNTVKISAGALERNQAGYLLEEGAEAVRTIRDDGWAGINTINNATTYYLSWNGSKWSLSTTASSISPFTRTLVFEAVSRDGNDDIVSTGGTLDIRTRKVTVSLSWVSSNGVSKNESLVFYIADIRT
jgi:type II secretory pathway pseudopilin PulG